MNPTYDVDTDTGHTVSGIPGWEGFRFEQVEVELVDGIPCLIGVNVRPIPGTPLRDLQIERERMARFPVEDLISVVAPFAINTGDDVTAALNALRTSTTAGTIRRPRGGSVEFSRAVAAIVVAERAMGRPTIAKVAETFRVSEARANQYVAEARDKYGLLGDGRRRPVPEKVTPTPVYDGSLPRSTPPRPFDESDHRDYLELINSPDHQKRRGRAPGKGSTAHRKDS